MTTGTRAQCGVWHGTMGQRDSQLWPGRDVNCHDTAKVLTNLMSYFVVIMQPYKRSRNPSTPLTWIHPPCKRNTKCTASSMSSRAPGLNWVPVVPWPLVSGLSGPLCGECREWPQQSEITLNTPGHCKLLYGCLKIWYCQIGSNNYNWRFAK